MFNDIATLLEKVEAVLYLGARVMKYQLFLKNK